MKKNPNSVKITNRKAKHDYIFLETYTAGIVLSGSEVKSVRNSRVSFTDCFCYFKNRELWIKNLQLTPIDVNYTHEPMQERKLLLHKKELRQLEKDLVKGNSIIPCEMFMTNGRIKLAIALAQGKRDYDKRNALKEKDINKETKKLLITL